jgi:4-amino-4-deoxy-L-arabinose transferase-like glycosyltransferase
MLVCWAAMALALLSKGLIGLLIPGTVLTLYVLVTRRWILLARLNWLAGPLLFLLIAAPWFVVVSMRNPDFAQFFFIHEHFQRYLTNEAHREGGWWYFFALLALGALPWTLLVPATLRDALKEPGAAFRPRLLLGIWVLFVLLFFSASQSKLPGYLTPLFPALALLLGERLARLPSPSVRPAIVTAAVFWALLLVASFFTDRIHSRSLSSGQIELIAANARWGTLAALGGAALAWVWRDRQPLLPLAVGSSLAVLIIIAGLAPYAYARSSKELVAAAAGDLNSASRLYSLGVYDQTLPFYLRRPVRLVAFTGEFEFGQARAPEMFPNSWAAFLKEWQEEKHPVAVTSMTRYRQLVDEGLPMKTLYSDPAEVVVTRP